MSYRRRHRHVPPLPDKVRLTEADIRDQFDARTFERGDGYQREGRVSDLSLEYDDEGAELTASVQGSGGNIYQVDIDLTAAGDITICAGFCSCPVEVDCKHVAATLLDAARSGWFDDDAPLVEAQGSPDLSSAKRALPKPELSVDPLAGPLSSWLDRLGTVMAAGMEGAAQPARAGKGAPAAEQLLYCFYAETYPNGADRTGMTIVSARPLKAGGWGAGRRMDASSVAQSSARHVTDADRAIARVLMTEPRAATGSWPQSGAPQTLEWVMERILATGRAHWLSKDGIRLNRGSDRPGRLVWRLTDLGNQVPRLEAEESGLDVLPGPSPWVVETATGACGKLLLPMAPDVLKEMLAVPPVPPEAAAALGTALAQRFPDLVIVPPRGDVAVMVEAGPPVPVLHLVSRKLPPPSYWGRSTPPSESWIDGAWLAFDYGGIEILPGAASGDIRTVDDTGVTVRKRRTDVELAAAKKLAAAGLSRIDPYGDPLLARAFDGGGLTFSLRQPPQVHGAYQCEDPFAWVAFMHEIVPGLVADGWRIDVSDGFRHRLVSADGDWQAAIEDKGGWWFSLDLGIEVEGERLALLPVLLSALARLKSGEPLGTLARGTILYGRLSDGRAVALPYERVVRLVEVLVEIFGDRRPGDGHTMDLSLAEAMGLAAISDATRLRWLGGERLRKLAERLGRGGITAEDRPLPVGFAAELRPYQRVGYAWLGFLADEGLGGILADDMGLGKTVQALAHILAEKTSGRMAAPFLVVCPTSLVASWRDEAARFAPDLRVVIMHGSGRPRDAGAFENADLVITTYPLLTHDSELLTSIVWHGIALDEAQAIKNPTAQWTQVACRLEAGHRLCLTGTPVENHLGEAWSLFTFLMPGLLGDAKAFAKVFRMPIEKRNDADRRSLLSRRLKPFLLRRTKAEVATELPAKTEMVRRVELSGSQRDLYETVRLTMDAKVREAIAAKGLGRSSIVVLDALLKLRQACCDPRLVRLKGTGRITPGSAKLDHIMEFLPALIEEGRRILLFSQFTSMLDLIKPELVKKKIAFVELTGGTVDRATPVEAFQEGAVPLFLISLKAGGVGLTLTAADTVIHYDPWWNPAVEDQATDRAHRIGQDKPVFVYKLIASGTVEERMLELQDRKRSVAAALFDPTSTGPLAFTEEDLAALFQPIV